MKIISITLALLVFLHVAIGIPVGFEQAGASLGRKVFHETMYQAAKAAQKKLAKKMHSTATDAALNTDLMAEVSDKFATSFDNHMIAPGLEECLDLGMDDARLFRGLFSSMAKSASAPCFPALVKHSLEDSGEKSIGQSKSYPNLECLSQINRCHGMPLPGFSPDAIKRVTSKTDLASLSSSE